MNKLETPYDAGRDSVISGRSIRNCHYGWFGTPERTREWERGRDEAERELGEGRATKWKLTRRQLTKRQREVLEKLLPRYSCVARDCLFHGTGWLIFNGAPLWVKHRHRAAARTVECLVREGYIASVTPNSYVITDAGRKALEEAR